MKAALCRVDPGLRATAEESQPHRIIQGKFKVGQHKYGAKHTSWMNAFKQTPYFQTK